jgi:hemerythrin superfamily protein
MVRISEAITEDHRKLEYLYETIIHSEDNDEQTRFQNQFTWELARHAVAEELIVYPAIEKGVPDGKEITDRDRREHATVWDRVEFR